MANYELVREILNHCPNNQMRDIYFLEVETDDPEAYVRNLLQGKASNITVNTLSHGNIEIFATCDGINQRFLFTEG